VGRLVYSAIASLDLYVADVEGRFDWAAPDEEVHAYVNDLERRVGTYLYGRRMYEVMRAWETEPAGDAVRGGGRLRPHVARGAEGRVLADLTEAPTARTSIERDLDPPLRSGRAPSTRSTASSSR
jgi:hypothetical protein